MASSTWDGSSEPEVHAEPLEAADTFHIQHDQKGFSFNELKAEIDIVRKTFHRVSVQPAVRDLFQNPADQIIPQLRFFRGSAPSSCSQPSLTALPSPTMPGTFSVPARRFRSCAPPWIKERILRLCGYKEIRFPSVRSAYVRWR